MPIGTSAEQTAWLCLDGVPGIGPVRALRLLAKASPQQLCQMDSCQLEHLGLSSAQIDSLKHPEPQRMEQVIRWCDEPGHHLVCYGDECYPTWLRAIPAAPLVLFVEGDVSLLSAPQIAMVGTRNPTSSGRSVAAMLTQELVAEGLVITSGMALGIDAVCHQTALQTQGRTLAVLGSGLRHCYPRRHLELSRQIVGQGGALVSELWPDVAPRAENFHRRNRIISGLSLGTLVVEAAAQSGSLITARYALEQGREVFAVPGSIHNPAALGCLHLIQQGAKLVCSAADIVEEIAIHLSGCGERQASLPLSSPPRRLPSSQLLDTVGYEVTPVDVVVQLSQQPIDRVMAELLELELSGWIESVSGGYVRTRRDG